MKTKKSTRPGTFVFSVALLIGSFFTQEALTYQEAGHFYSIYPSTASAKLTADERRLLAFCAQLPDQSKDLDAVAVYRAVLAHPIDWARWGTSDVVDTDWVRSMVTVQQLVHVLTGGEAGAVQEAAKAAVIQLFNNIGDDGDRRTNICALGIGLHMYGDSFAHQRMADNTTLMYSTGKGHAADFSYPDYPLCDGYLNGVHWFQTCNKVVTGECADSSAKPVTGARPPATGEKPVTRFCRWLQYPASGAVILKDPVAGQIDVTAGPGLKMLAKDFEDAAPNSNDRNHWGEDEVEGNLVRDEQLPPEIAKFFKGQSANNDCQVVMDAALHDSLLQLTPNGTPAASELLSCAKVWNAYAPTIVSELAKTEAGGKVVREKLGNVKWSNDYRCPLLDRGYRAESDELCN